MKNFLFVDHDVMAYVFVKRYEAPNRNPFVALRFLHDNWFSIRPNFGSDLVHGLHHLIAQNKVDV